MVHDNVDNWRCLVPVPKGDLNKQHGYLAGYKLAERAIESNNPTRRISADKLRRLLDSWGPRYVSYYMIGYMYIMKKNKEDSPFFRDIWEEVERQLNPKCPQDGELWKNAELLILFNRSCRDYRTFVNSSDSYNLRPRKC